jgi:hypothetical protein
MGFLQVVCLDRAELRDEPFMVFKNNHFLFWTSVLNSKFLRNIAKNIVPL